MSYKKIQTFAELNVYFFEKLDEINAQTSRPLNQEFIFYSSELLSKYAQTSKLFDESKNGKYQYKFLGIKLIEADNSDIETKKRNYQDIAETSLFLCGYFSNSLNQKIFNPYHYRQIGMSAYERLDKLVPQFLGIPSFYRQMSKNFFEVSDLITVFASKDQSDPLKHFLAS